MLCCQAKRGRQDAAPTMPITPQGQHPAARVITISTFRQYRVGRGILDAPCTAEFDNVDGMAQGDDGASRKPRPTNAAPLPP